MMTNKVVVKFKDNSIVKGQTNNFLPNKTCFHLLQLEGGQIELHIEDLKAIFLLKIMMALRIIKKHIMTKCPVEAAKFK